MQPPARIDPPGPATVMAAPHSMLWTGAPSRIGRASASPATSVPNPSAICGVSPARLVSM